jgi:hypothetical protein
LIRGGGWSAPLTPHRIHVIPDRLAGALRAFRAMQVRCRPCEDARRDVDGTRRNRAAQEQQPRRPLSRCCDRTNAATPAPPGTNTRASGNADGVRLSLELLIAKCAIVDVMTSLETARRLKTQLEAAPLIRSMTARQWPPPAPSARCVYRQLDWTDASTAGHRTQRRPLTPGTDPTARARPG